MQNCLPVETFQANAMVWVESLLLALNNAKRSYASLFRVRLIDSILNRNIHTTMTRVNGMQNGYRISAEVCRNGVSNLLLKKRNLTAIPLILIPGYGQSNVTLGYCFSSRSIYRRFTVNKAFVG